MAQYYKSQKSIKKKISHLKNSKINSEYQLVYFIILLITVVYGLMNKFTY